MTINSGEGAIVGVPGTLKPENALATAKARRQKARHDDDNDSSLLNPFELALLLAGQPINLGSCRELAPPGSQTFRNP